MEGVGGEGRWDGKWREGRLLRCQIILKGCVGFMLYRCIN